MGRPSDGGRIKAIIDELRRRIPGLVLRTTLMTGFPGETEQDFDDLYRFVREIRFERLGVFSFSPEEGTRALKLPGKVPVETAEIRAEALMKAQEEITAEFQASLVGQEFDMIVDEHNDKTGAAAGRTYHDAPEIDCRVNVPAGVEPGQPFARVRIVSAEGYDLEGEVKPWQTP
jgi:ribosomal protein S12 methylthiotransferase